MDKPAGNRVVYTVLAIRPEKFEDIGVITQITADAFLGRFPI